MAKSQLNSSSNCLDNKRWRREKRRDGEAKNTTDGLKQRTEEIELFSKEKKRWRIRLSPGCCNYAQVLQIITDLLEACVETLDKFSRAQFLQFCPDSCSAIDFV
jgi:hypothetical protein